MSSDEDMAKTVYQSFCRGMEQPSFADFQQGLGHLSVEFSGETLRHIFEKHDKNRDGRLSPTEFRSMCGTYPKLGECLYHRLSDRRAQDIHDESVAHAEEQVEISQHSCQQRDDQLAEANERIRDAEAQLAEQVRLLEEEREREAAARQEDEAERHDQVSTRQADQVASALDKAAKGVCEEKKEQFYASVSEEDICAFAEKLSREWRDKEGDVVDELIANLKTPDSVRSKLAVVAEAARHLHETRGSHYAGRNRVELLVMALYTMAGPDIDALVTFENVPTFDEGNADPWNAYTKQYSKERNGAIFSAINWAMRTAADPKKAETSEGAEAWDTCKKWIKYICLLLAICAQVEPQQDTQGAELARGLAGLPVEVVDAHSALKVNDTISWPSASSCAFDRTVSESYIRGDAANATKREGGSILFLLAGARWGVALQAISKYPKEAEMLLPPFAKFNVSSQDIDPSLNNALVLRMAMAGHNAPELFCHQVTEAGNHSAKRLQTALVAHAETALRDRTTDLERQRQRERQAGGDVLRTERDVDRQRNRLSVSEADTRRAQERLRELEKLLEEQRHECGRQEEIVQRNVQELTDAEELREAAARDQEDARRKVKEAEDVVKDASEALDGVKKAKEQRRQETQRRLTDARHGTSKQERDKDAAERALSQNKASLQNARNELELAAHELQESERRLQQMQEAAEAARKRRQMLNDEERFILDQEVKLVMQRCALEEKETKHYSDLRAFDEVHRPPTAASPQRAAEAGRQEKAADPAAARPVPHPHMASPSMQPAAPPSAARHPGAGAAGAAQEPPPPAALLKAAQAASVSPVELVFTVELLDENDAVGLYWEGNDEGDIVVKSVTPHGAAWRVGIRELLKLLRVDGLKVRSKEDVQAALRGLRVTGKCQMVFANPDAPPDAHGDYARRGSVATVNGGTGSPAPSRLGHPLDERRDTRGTERSSVGCASVARQQQQQQQQAPPSGSHQPPQSHPQQQQQQQQQRGQQHLSAVERLRQDMMREQIPRAQVGTRDRSPSAKPAPVPGTLEERRDLINEPDKSYLPRSVVALASRDDGRESRASAPELREGRTLPHEATPQTRAAPEREPLRVGRPSSSGAPCPRPGAGARAAPTGSPSPSVWQDTQSDARDALQREVYTAPNRGVSPAPRTMSTSYMAHPQYVGSPSAASHTGSVFGATAPTNPPTAPAPTMGGVPPQDASGASLERRIAALSAAVAASRDRTVRPRGH